MSQETAAAAYRFPSQQAPSARVFTQQRASWWLTELHGRWHRLGAARGAHGWWGRQIGGGQWRCPCHGNTRQVLGTEGCPRAPSGGSKGSGQVCDGGKGRAGQRLMPGLAGRSWHPGSGP